MAGTVTVRRKRKETRQPMGMPNGAIVDLRGLDEIQGQGDQMIARNRSGEIGLAVAAAPGGERSAAKVEVGEFAVAPRGLSGRVWLQPLSLNQVWVDGMNDTRDADGDKGVGWNGVVYHCAFGLQRQKDSNGVWQPLRLRDPARDRLRLLVTAEGAPIGQDGAGLVYESLYRGAELFFRAHYRLFVLAELAYVNNALFQWEQDNHVAKTGQRLDGTKAVADEVALAKGRAFSKLRFSGDIAALKAAEAPLRAWLADHPA